MTHHQTELLKACKSAIDNCHAPYSKQLCSAAVRCDSGTYLGATLDNCAYPNSICAPFAAIVNAVSSGATQVHEMVIFSKSGPSEPCGMCLEMASEMGDFPILIHRDGQPDSTPEKTTVRTLLPHLTSTKSPFIDRKRPQFDKLHLGEYKMDPSTVIPDGIGAETFTALCTAAVRACVNSYPILSDFPVGAAVLTDSDEIVSGANIETSRISVCLCAERTALCKSVAGGMKRVKAIALVCAKSPDYGSPCGGCRQNMVEFEEYPVYELRLLPETKTFIVKSTTSLELLPHAFTPAALV